MTIPTLRFKADDSSKFGEWKSIQLKDIAERIARKNKEENQNNVVPLIRPLNSVL